MLTHSTSQCYASAEDMLACRSASAWGWRPPFCRLPICRSRSAVPLCNVMISLESGTVPS